MLKVKRVYDKPSKNDGPRILVDRLWPRGLSKQRAKIDLWLKDIAPSDGLRKWYAHDQKKWTEFKHRYFEELNGKKHLIALINEKVSLRSVTILYAAKGDKFNNATALKEYIEKHSK